MHFFKSSIVILAATCKLALAFDCHSPYGAGGCLDTVAGSVDILSPALQPNGRGTTYFLCEKGLNECCLDATFKIPPGRIPDPNKCQLG
ncbi:hypothetical protein PGT21_031933 [Puccinia graminis f. sp. tritici]|uniref:Hydrophobin n=2 Tax=Puccinia graminis f. sp. tritici TaxID=56615 RepID=E3KH27_PUCGT|nr:uncharacterized protein PGTG_09315 [Puccinia graminis f. sp. tritici CRL 75-36-700-3]EFP83602.1 hypothetical protein PGTG_09315 [Puccinia graminis f. sp. tritici CRL 75-36-700-3]KAA1066323.1 hypothetical protein PGT21_028425 [Puccinia graminis f. sp. tritici]KAA1087458.1 hypothetical protein PGT21_031933 [Puccinia graminis f. sp. tritici]KAA1128358.1 hypothetical protein PGTUg99_013772 [Puccinia graminis f. sp. tritici]